MPAPGYTTSFVVQLKNAVSISFDEIDQNLRKLPGVEDVVIVEEAAMAYLKVDRQHFREEQLAHFGIVRQGSNASNTGCLHGTQAFSKRDQEHTMARGVNKVILIGNLGQDPDTRYTPNGNAVVNLNLATDESYKDRQSGQLVPKTEWHRVVLFGKVAEVAGQYLRKGSKVYIEGRLQTRKWQGQDGQDRYTTEIVVDINGQMQMLDSRGGEGGMNQGAPQGRPQQAASYNNPPPQQQQGGQGNQGGGYSNQPPQQQGGGMPEPIDDFDDDIPF